MLTMVVKSSIVYHGTNQIAYHPGFEVEICGYHLGFPRVLRNACHRRTIRISLSGLILMALSAVTSVKKIKHLRDSNHLMWPRRSAWSMK